MRRSVLVVTLAVMASVTALAAAVIASRGEEPLRPVVPGPVDADSVAVIDPARGWAMAIGPEWAETLPGDTERSWSVGGMSGRATVNVVLDDVGVRPPSLQAYVSANRRLLAEVFDTLGHVDAVVVRFPDGSRVGVLRYRAVLDGRELGVLQVLAVGEARSGMATLTAPAADFDEHAAALERYLLTLRVA